MQAGANYAMVKHMARETFEIILDDLDGSHGAQAYTFALRGQTYSIDLCEENYQRLVEALEPFIAVAQKGERQAKPAGNGRRSKAYLAQLREWALANGYEIPERGKVPNRIEQEYVKHLTEPVA